MDKDQSQEAELYGYYSPEPGYFIPVYKDPRCEGMFIKLADGTWVAGAGYCFDCGNELEWRSSILHGATGVCGRCYPFKDDHRDVRAELAAFVKRITASAS